MDPYIEKFSALNLNNRNSKPQAADVLHKCSSSDPGYGRIVSKAAPHNVYSNYSTSLLNGTSNSSGRAERNSVVRVSGSCSPSCSAVGENMCAMPESKKNAIYGRTSSFHENPYQKVEDLKNSNLAKATASYLKSHHLNAHTPVPLGCVHEQSYSGSPMVAGQVCVGGSAVADLEYRLKNCPVYENVGYYNGRGMGQLPASHYHQLQHGLPHSRSSSQDSKHSSPRGSVAATDNTFVYESLCCRAQPQVPVGSQYVPSSHSKEYQTVSAFHESPPVYENLQSLSAKSYNHEPAKPGPQVPIASEHKQIVAPVNADLGFIASPYSTVVDPTKLTATASATRILASVQHQVLRSPQHRANIAQALAADEANQLSHYGISGQPRAASAAALASQMNKAPSNLSVGSDGQPSRSYSRLENNLAASKADSASYNSDLNSLSANKLLPYNVTPPRPMVRTHIDC